MIILRGQYAGRTGTVRQFSNDWVTVDVDGGPSSLVVTPTHIQITTDADRESFRDRSDRVGFFWQLWELFPDGTFNCLHPTTIATQRGGSRGRRPVRRGGRR